MELGEKCVYMLRSPRVAHLAAGASEFLQDDPQVVLIGAGQIVYRVKEPAVGKPRGGLQQMAPDVEYWLPRRASRRVALEYDVVKQ